MWKPFIDNVIMTVWQ